MLDEFAIAKEKANEVNKKLIRKSDSFVSSEKIVEVVEEISGYDIKISFVNFSELGNDDTTKALRKSGAILSTVENANEKKATIFINNENSAPKQRFALVHELGHLITSIPNYMYEIPNDGLYTISSQINPDITCLSDEMCNNNNYYKAEQVANVFALYVLIPDEITISLLTSLGADSLAAKYGVTKESIYSRMLISSVE